MTDHHEHDLVVVLTYYAPYVSGLTNVARDVAEGMAARGLRVCVVTSQHDPALPTEEHRNGVRVVRAPVIARIGKGTIGLNLTRLALREMRRARVVNLHLPLIEAGILAALSPSPVVVTYHCDVSLAPSAWNRLQQAAIDRSSALAMRYGAVVMVSSEDYARHSRLRTRIEPRMVSVPPPCRPVTGGRPTFRNGPGLHVGFLGRIVEEKGIEYLVDAFRALDDPHARLLIGGDHEGVAGGSVVERVRGRIGDDPRIRLLGYLGDDELPDFYRSLDVLALPSVNAFEAFGIVQVVGMLSGVPAVVSDLPGVRTPVQRTGFGEVVAPRDVAGLTAALRRVRDAPPERAAGAAAAAAAFSVERVLDAYEQVLTARIDDRAGVEMAVDRVPDHTRNGVGMHGTAPDRSCAGVAAARGTVVPVDRDDRAGRRRQSRLDIARGEARIVVTRARREVRARGVLGTVAFFGGLVVEQARFPLLKRRRADARILFAGTRIPYAYHVFNQTWRNERCLEVAVARHFLGEHPRGRMLELGNVLGHYGVGGHQVVDRYENVMGARNVDVLALDEPDHYDTVVSISSLEHVRFDEDEQDPHGPALALAKLRASLAPGGRLLVTVPIGYNPGMDADIVSGRFALQDQTFYQRVSSDGDWEPVTAEQALRCRYGTPYEAANAVLVGTERREPRP